MDAAGHEAWDTLTAALLQITQHAERLAALDEREAAHHQQVDGRLTALAQQLAETTGARRRGPGHRRSAGSDPNRKITGLSLSAAADPGR